VYPNLSESGGRLAVLPTFLFRAESGDAFRWNLHARSGTARSLTALNVTDQETRTGCIDT
jgi:hypothetical protein